MSLLWNRLLCSAVGTCRKYINITAVRLDDSQTESVLWVTKNVGSRIIGKGGERVKDISMKTNSRIHLDIRIDKEGEIPITIRGTAEACANAREIIKQIRAEASESNTSETRLETILWIPKAQCGVIIGKGGAVIKGLQQDTGANIGLDKDLMKDGLTPLTICGHPDKFADAKQRIEQLLASDNASGTTVWVAEKQLGLIIGKGGATIKALKKTTGAYIQFNQAGVKDGFVAVTLKGQDKDCTAAKHRINELLSKSIQ